MKIIIPAAAAVLFVLCLSCTKESTKLTYANQESNIEKFVNTTLASHSSDTAYTVNNGGCIRLVLTEGSGEELSASGTVTFYYAGYVFNSSSISNSNLFATNISEIAENLGWTLSREDALEPVTEKLSGSSFVTGLRKGLEGVKGGEECYILFSGKYGFGDKQLGTIPANSALAYYIKVTEVSN